MTTPISRRTVLAVGAGAAAGLALPVAAHAHQAVRARFTLDAEVLDGGEQVTSITLHTARLGRVDPASLTTGTFTVHAKATSPIPIAPGDQIFSEYDLDRAVTAARVDRHGDVVLDLAYAEGVTGGGTLGYIASKGRNVRLNLVYTITQQAPLVLRGGRPLTITEFRQGRLSNPEVDAFGYGIARSGMKYRLFKPHARGRRPLVVWLHGGGEGASLPDNYYDNETQLRANRGAIGFVTDEAQRIFGGAYVVAPQSQSFWMEDGPRFAPQIREIIRDVVRRHDVDPSRVYVVGCSNGGYMSMEMTVTYPELFAASVPICGVVQSLQPGGPRLITDAELAAISTPTWLVASRDDTTVPPEPNTIHAHDLIPGSLLTLYDHVVWNGHQFAGHWSWIYVARNDPAQNGQHIWQWMAARRRRA
ncbi:prolyl oligopeptidase family serine peptidase [Paractinoplanes lichenicola]|uniref:Prolyl oligopeptidase family serine peptidase n=1 Tax=Paractinoplanes lichenicola TaxID=2802976 RepID=A0ABS1W683_9ACTN|nr:PHB depolymerase family esterase [Actinoplanes lichenicola]MBL7262232.1 prolyl oligopeptidase family serine peptidase [Actinoplanes lichenicola]